ncbi:HNH endonuclease [Verrucosispora sp. NA02020]|uniref:HNH endonuclease n=1 Tax=Verrucosispora sp. NA02020 TaxID=2742132 RepID=UPI003D758EC5
MCGTSVSDEQFLTIPQCDHKIPADRGGESKLPNLQTLCTRCNLKKRQACSGCKLASCEGCPFAYPEKFSAVFVVSVSDTAAKQIRELAFREGITPDAAISRLVEKTAL